MHAMHAMHAMRRWVPLTIKSLPLVPPLVAPRPRPRPRSRSCRRNRPSVAIALLCQRCSHTTAPSVPRPRRVLSARRVLRAIRRVVENRKVHGLSSAQMALITSDCIEGPNHLGWSTTGSASRTCWPSPRSSSEARTEYGSGEKRPDRTAGSILPPSLSRPRLRSVRLRVASAPPRPLFHPARHCLGDPIRFTPSGSSQSARALLTAAAVR